MGQVMGIEFQFCKMKRCRDLFHNNMIWNFLLVQRWGLHTFLSGAWIWSSTRELSWMDWLDLLEVYGTLKSLLQHHSSKASILRYSAFFTVQLSHPFTTTGKTVVLTRQTFVGKVMSLLLNMLSTLVITFSPGSKRLLISWLQSASAVILEPPKIKSATVFPIYFPWSDGTRCHDLSFLKVEL